MKTLRSFKNGIKAQKYCISLSWSTAPFEYILSITIEFFNNFLPLVTAYLWKIIIDKFQIVYSYKSIAPTIWLFISFFVAVELLRSIVNYGNRIVSDSLGRKMKKKLNIQLLDRMSRLKCSFFDNPDNKDMISKVNMFKHDIERSIRSGISLAIMAVSFISGLVMFIPYNPILGVIYILTYVPGSVVQYQEKKRLDLYSIESIPECRKKDYYKSILINEAYAKDLRMYNLCDYFTNFFNCSWNALRKKRNKLFRNGTWKFFCTTSLSVSGFIILIIWSARSVLLGKVTLGVLSMYIALSKTLGMKFNSITFSLPIYINVIAPRILSYKAFVEKTNGNSEKTEIELSNKLSVNPSIEFRDVCFKYPSSEKNAINHLSFKISSKEKVAIVGINGAGKSTIIKLLLRYYEPQNGQILLDNVDIKFYSIEHIRKCFSVCFQDINKYSLTFRENIALSDISRLGDTYAIKNVAKLSGANVIYDKFHGDIDFNLTRNFDNSGYEPSGGQWQKIAIARAFYRDSSCIILDEPSSELDSEAEDVVFRKFSELVINKGCIIISHRLSFISLVDKIIYIKNGFVVDCGTHRDLIKRNEEYLNMYNMQAEKYGKGLI